MVTRPLFTDDGDGIALRNCIKLMLVYFAIGLTFWPVARALVRASFLCFSSYFLEMEIPTPIVYFRHALANGWSISIRQFLFSWIVGLVLILAIRRKTIIIPILGAMGVVFIQICLVTEMFQEGMLDVPNDYLLLITTEAVVSALAAWMISRLVYAKLFEAAA